MTSLVCRSNSCGSMLSWVTWTWGEEITVCRSHGPEQPALEPGFLAVDCMTILFLLVTVVSMYFLSITDFRETPSTVQEKKVCKSLLYNLIAYLTLNNNIIICHYIFSV